MRARRWSQGAAPRCKATSQVSAGSGGVGIGNTSPAAPVGQGRRPQPDRLSSRFRFCPAAIMGASPAISKPCMFAFSNPRSLSRRKPCHSLASAKSGSTQTWRLRIAFWYASVA
jgi:hypothetical protein